MRKKEIRKEEEGAGKIYKRGREREAIGTRRKVGKGKERRKEKERMQSGVGGCEWQGGCLSLSVCRSVSWSLGRLQQRRPSQTKEQGQTEE